MLSNFEVKYINAMAKNKIKTIRERLGYTQADLAELSNLSTRTIQRLESGGNQPKGHTLKVLAKALNVEPSVLQNEAAQEVRVNQVTQGDTQLRLLNLSTLCFIGIPFGNILVPFMIWKNNRTLPLVNEWGRRIISFQVIWTLCTVSLLIVSPFIQAYLSLNFSLMLILGLLAVVINLFFIFKTAAALLRRDYDVLPLKAQLI